MKNKIADLNNHLFEQLERLNDEDLTGDKLATEVERTKAISIVSSQIINNAKLALNAIALKGNMVSDTSLPEFFEDEKCINTRKQKRIG